LGSLPLYRVWVVGVVTRSWLTLPIIREERSVSMPIAINSLRAGLQTGAHRTARTIVGFSARLFGAAHVLITETAFPTYRARVTAAYKYVRRDSYPNCCFPRPLFCSESPRWLISQDRSDEDRAVFAKYHASGRLPLRVLSDSCLCDVSSMQLVWKARRSTLPLGMQG
jgi:hypothetical protein